jgi:hypothetical protein
VGYQAASAKKRINSPSVRFPPAAHVDQRKEPEQGGVQNALARYIGVMHPHGQTRHYSYASAQSKPGPRVATSYSDLKGFRWPVIWPMLKVPLCCTRTLVTIGRPLGHNAEVALNRSGQAFRFTQIDGLRTNRHAGRTQTCLQFLRTGVPAVGPVEPITYRDGGEAKHGSNERSEQLGAVS